MPELSTKPFALRQTSLEDAPALERLIVESVRALSRADYSGEQIDAALGTALGLDRELIRDGTYFAVESSAGIVGCGGWSRRETLFGGDGGTGRQSRLPDPAREAARLRAFFVRPDWSRRGIGRALIARCEGEARAAGFRSMQLMATLPGARLYRASGYLGHQRIPHVLPDGTTIEFIPMAKPLD